MKHIRNILIVVAALFAVTAKAQTLVTLDTFTVNANVTSNLPNSQLVIDCGSQRNVALKWQLQLGGAGTEVMGIRFQPSIDGTLPTTPTTAGGYMMAVAANGTTAVTVQTNFDTLGYRYLVGYYVTNGNASQVLTNTISYLVKRNAP